MMMILLTIFTVVFAILPSLINGDACRFQHTKGVIDLTSLGRTDGRPQYPDKIPPSGSNYRYSYNPCKPFSEGNACINVAVCQVSLDGQFSFTLGIHETASWDPGAALGGTPSVSYSSGEKRVKVELECRRSGPDEFEALGEDPINNYKFRLAHRCACWDECGTGPQPTTTTKKSPSGGGDEGGISGGTVFIILLLVLLFVYFAGFAAFSRFQLQRSGAELIAHRTFWASLPGYAKDGAVYVYRRISNKGADPYSSV